MPRRYEDADELVPRIGHRNAYTVFCVAVRYQHYAQKKHAKFTLRTLSWQFGKHFASMAGKVIGGVLAGTTGAFIGAMIGHDLWNYISGVVVNWVSPPPLRYVDLWALTSDEDKEECRKMALHYNTNFDKRLDREDRRRSMRLRR